MEPSTKDETKLIQTPQEFAAAITIMVTKALLSSEKEPEVKMYLKDLSIFQYHDMEVTNDFIISMSNRVKYTVIVDEEAPLFAFDGTPFKTIMEKHPDHVVFRWMKKCPNIPHFIMSGSMSIVECYDVKPKQWLLSMADAVDVVSIRTLAFDALLEQSSNPRTKESPVEKNLSPHNTNNITIKQTNSMEICAC